MRYATVASGIETATLAWRPLGWHPIWFSEIDPFCCALLRHYYPQIHNLGDMHKISKEAVNGSKGIDVFAGGTPCQSFSVAGFRRGLDDPRGNHTLEFLRLVSYIEPRWIIWENVPGVLSCDNGGAFGIFITALVKLGYGIAWRVLDAQWFGLAQHRRRVWVIGYRGAKQCAAAILFEPNCAARTTASHRKKQSKTIVNTLTTSPTHTPIEASGLVINDTSVRRLTPREYERLQGIPDDYTLIPTYRKKPNQLRMTKQDVIAKSIYTGISVDEIYEKGITSDRPRYRVISNAWSVPVAQWIGRRIKTVERVKDV